MDIVTGTDIVPLPRTDAEAAVASAYLRLGIDLGVPIGRDIERAEAALSWRQLAGRIRATAGEPSHQELVARRRRHQVAAARRARQCSADWPGSAA